MPQKGIKVFLSSGHDKLSRYLVKLKTVLSDCDFRSWDQHQSDSGGGGWGGGAALHSPAQRRETEAAEETIDQRFTFCFNQGGTGIVSVTDDTQSSLELTAFIFSQS